MRCVCSCGLGCLVWWAPPEPLSLDSQWLQDHTNPQCWTPFFKPTFDLPINILLQFFRRGLLPHEPADRADYCARISAEPVLSDRLMVPSITRPGSWAIAVDNTPQRLLQPGGFGLCAGVLESRRQVWLGVPSLLAMPVQYGLSMAKPASPTTTPVPTHHPGWHNLPRERKGV